MRDFIRVAKGTIKRMYRRYSMYLQLWYIRLSWIITSVHDDAFRCAEIKFVPRNGTDMYPVEISEAEYLYDLDAAILRIYYKNVLPNYKAKKVIGNTKKRLKRDKQTKKEWNILQARNVYDNLRP